MDEEEINSNFEIAKEALVKGYLKKMDSLLIKEEKEDAKPKDQKILKKTDEEIKLLIHKYEKEFIEKSNEMRKKYDIAIEKIHAVEVKRLVEKEKKDSNFKPKLKVRLINAWKKIKATFSKDKKEFDSFYILEIKLKRKRASQKIGFFIKDKLHPSKLFYLQHIWPILHYLNTPNRILKLKMAKLHDKLKEILKAVIGKLKDKISKAIKFIVSKLKALIEKIKKIIAKIVEVIKKTIGYVKKVIKVIQMRFFPKKE
jgi:hypothetical protein